LLPIYECLINRNWQEEGIAGIVVARQHSNGNLTLAIYMVDVFCRGVKDTLYQFNIPMETYLDIIDSLSKESPLVKAEYSLVHNIIYGAIEYADDLGFTPHRNFTKVTAYLLEEDDENIELIDIEFGLNGKPLLIVVDENEPYKKYMAILDKHVGKENYNYMLPSGEASEEIDDIEDTFDVDMDFSIPPYNILEPILFDDETENIIEKELNEYYNSDEEGLEKVKEEEKELHSETKIRLIELFFADMFPTEKVQEAYDFGMKLFEGIEIADPEKLIEELIDGKDDGSEDMLDEIDMEQLFQCYEDINADKYKKAIKTIKKLLIKYPDNPNLLHLLYISHQSLDKIRKSEDIILYAFQKHPNYFAIRTDYLNYLVKKEKYDEFEKITAAGLTIKEVNPGKSRYTLFEALTYYQPIFLYHAYTKQLLKAKSMLYQFKKYGMSNDLYETFYELYIDAVDNVLDDMNNEMQAADS